MRFFEWHQEPKEHKIAITGLLSNITTKPSSHKGGWTRILKCQLEKMGYDHVKILDNKDSLLDFDTVIFDLGAEFSGALNMFGGLDEKTYKRLKELYEFKGKRYSWRHSLPKLSEALKSRDHNASTCEAYKAEPEDFLSVLDAGLYFTAVFDHTYPTDKLLIGDSHTAGVWTPEYMIERRDGRTLTGMVNNDTIKKTLEKFPANVPISEVFVHASSIDIRHHWGRDQGPVKSAEAWAKSLVQNLYALGLKDVSIMHTMGIENESRELPKTGFFKGTPFYGNWFLRNSMRCSFNDMIDEVVGLGWKPVRYPYEFFNEQGELMFEVMEKPQSVHISPEFYRTDLDTGKVRW
jgi:hypothetical protein